MEVIVKRNIQKRLKKIVRVNSSCAKKCRGFGILGFLGIHTCTVNVPIAIMDFALEDVYIIY